MKLESSPISTSYQEPSSLLSKFLRVDSRGPKEQIANSVALECFKRQQELCPGYFYGVKSWVKSICYRGIAGITYATALGLVGWGVWEVGTLAFKAGYAPHLLASLLAGELTANKLGFEPVNALVALAVMSVRDTANLAAKWSIKADERTLEARLAEGKECHKEIIQQLTLSHNGCANALRKQYAIAAQDPGEILKLIQTANALEERLPVVAKFLRQFELTNPEIAIVLQELKEAIRFVQTQACTLRPNRGEWNARLLTAWPKTLIRQVAIPVDTKERIVAAQQSRLGIVDRFKGYAWSTLTGAETLVGVAAAAAAIYATTQYGLGASWGYLNGCIQGADWCSNHLTLNQAGCNSGAMCSVSALGPKAIVGLGGLALAAVGSATAIFARKASQHRQVIKSNAEYVDKELASCQTELRAIYDGVSSYLKTLRGSDKSRIVAELKEKMPLIRSEMGRWIDPSPILGGLERAVQSVQMPEKPYGTPYHADETIAKYA